MTEKLGIQWTSNPEAWEVKGVRINYLTREMIVSMYPHLEKSPFWEGRMVDTYLAVFFSTDRNPVRAIINGRVYGRSAWAIGLKRYGDGSEFEQLARFADACTGQQKNMLAALCTVAQAQVANTCQMSFRLDQWAKAASPSCTVFKRLGLQQQPVQMRLVSGSCERQCTCEWSCLVLPDCPILVSRVVGGHRRTDQEMISALAAQCQKGFRVTKSKKIVPGGEEEKVETSPYAIQIEQRMGWIRGQCRDNSVRVVCRVGEQWSSYAWREKEHRRTFEQMLALIVSTGGKGGDVFRSPPLLISEVVLAGSKMGALSGVWHESFEEIVQDTVKKITYYDLFEKNSREAKGGVEVSHVRGEAPLKYADSQILIDDCQAEDEINVYLQLPRIWSLKKRGTRAFCIPERRQFSHYHPPDFFNPYSSCQCHVCSSVSFAAWAMGKDMSWWEMVRDRLSRFGPVCSSDRSKTLRTENYLLELKLMKGPSTMSRRQTEAQKLYPSVRVSEGVASLEPTPEIPDWLVKKLKGKRGAVFAQYDRFKGLEYQMIRPYEFVVIGNARDMVEFGSVPLVVSTTSILIPGYRLFKTEDSYYVYERVRATPILGCDFSL